MNNAMNDDTPTRRAELAARFAAQARFCERNSPLYRGLFALLGKRLDLFGNPCFALRSLLCHAERSDFSAKR